MELDKDQKVRAVQYCTFILVILSYDYTYENFAFNYTKYTYNILYNIIKICI